MRKPLVVGNWKMHGCRTTVAELAIAVTCGCRAARLDVVLCPPTVYLADVATQLQKTPVMLGAQNVSEYEEGAFTGEVAGAMLADVGCRYVIVGHSERRRLFGETDVAVAAKFAAARRARLIPILCIGENQQQRQLGNTLAVIRSQLRAIADSVGVEALTSAVVAYEPIWAIGTGNTATPAQAQNIHRAIRSELGSLGASTRILYGGSVKATNAEELLAQEDIDGALVGGASLNADEFNAICGIADQS